MKLKFLLFIFSFFFLAAIGYGQDTTQSAGADTLQRIGMDTAAQATAIDSAQLLKKQERAGKISGQLARNRAKLADLEKEYQERTAEKQKAIAQAEFSAKENREAAEELSSDAVNRAKARRAQNSANRARRDAKSVQRAEINLERVEKNINKVKKLIEDDEKALREAQGQ